MPLELEPGVQVFAPLPCLYIKSVKALVFADAHLGFEEDMAGRGVFLPRVQLRGLISVLEEAFDTVDPARVIIVGDVKHKFDNLSRQEAREVGRLFEYLTKERGVEVHLVRGNHDNYIPTVARKYGVALHDTYLKVDRYLFIHGHTDLPRDDNGYEIVVMGHEHPSLVLRDEIGSVGKLQCFLSVPLRTGAKAVVLPAAGLYQTGTSVSLSKEAYLSPIIKEHAVLEEAKPIVFDKEVGVLEFPRLGSIADLLAP